MPSIAVTVDLLTTGIDVEAINTVVFLRGVKSRILYEQMLGRATRLCGRIGKASFRVFDAVGVTDALLPDGVTAWWNDHPAVVAWLDKTVAPVPKVLLSDEPDEVIKVEQLHRGCAAG